MFALCLLPSAAGAATTYALKVAGVDVTSDNCNDLSVITGVTGTVKYDDATKTLTLQDATINSADDDGINSKIDGLKIQVNGSNTISAYYDAIGLYANGTITGTGTLNLSTAKYSAIYVEKVDVTIDGCTIIGKGGYGIAGYDGSSEDVTISNATVTMEGTSGSVADVKSLTLNGCFISKPVGATFNSVLCAVVGADGNKVRTQVQIEPTVSYDLKVGGVTVTNANSADLSTVAGVTAGTISYDNATKTLTFKDVTFDAGDEDNIENSIDGLIVNVVGTNTFKSTTDALWVLKPITISGNGTLNINSSNGSGIYVEKTDLTVDGCTLNVTSTKWGICGYDGSTEDIVINNADVTATGTQYGSIIDVKSLTLTGCSITSPSGATFNSSLSALVGADGNKLKTKVVITRNTADGILGLHADDAATQPNIYNLQGVKMSQPLNSLPKGIYIVNGKKMIKK